MLSLIGILVLGSLLFGGRRNSSFPGGILLLPALICGGWVAIAVLGGVFSLLGSVIGGIFSGMTSVASGAFSGKGLVVGIVIGFILYFWFRRQKNETSEEE